MTNPKSLINTTDANVWASAFCQMFKDKYGVDVDEKLMFEWFGAAIVAGYNFDKLGWLPEETKQE